MNFNKFVCGLFNKTLAFLTSFSLVFQAPLLTYLYAQSPAIVPDGRTQTSVISNPTGTVTDIRTNSIRGINAYNSFEKFNVPNGNTTNLHVPNSARNLVNLVHNERSQIDGILNSYKNGQIGGNVFFLNPHGIVVGAGGVVNVGSLNLQTPTSQYLKDLISTNGEISAIHEQQLFEGKVPLSPSGVISVKGKINAVEEIQLKAGNVNISENAQVRAGRQVQVEFGDLVNVQGVNWGNDIIVTPEGKIKIVAVNDVNIAGKVKADAVAGNDAGKIEIESGNDINVQKGANISAKAETQNSNGGEIIIYADNNSTLEKDALIDVSATQNAKGGFLEFSATKNVNITGNGLKSSTGGKILIDPDDINWTGSGKDQFTSNGANYELLADKSIKLTDVYISTRQVSGSDRNAHLNGDSTGNSGNITLKAEDITLTNSYLLTHATGNYNAGNIIIEAMPHVENGNVTLATNVDVKLVNSFLYANASGTGTAGDVKISLTDNSWNTKYDYGGDSNLSFTMDKDSVIKGKNVDVKVVSVSGTKIELNKDAESDSDGVLDGVGEKVADTAETVLDLVVGIAGSLLITGRNNQTHAKINIEGTIEATGDIKIDSLAESHAEFMNIGVIVTLAGVYIEANSEVTIGGNAVIKTLGSGSVNITSKAVTVADITTMELGLVNKVPADVAIAVVVAYSDNKLTVNSGAEITSAKDIAIEALTERTQAVSVSSGSGDSTFGLTLGMIYGDSNVDAKIDGNLSAVENIMLSAKTDTKKNQIVTATTLADGLYTNITKALNQTTGLIDGVKGGIFGGIKKITKGKVDLTTPSADKPFDSLGIAGAIALLLDNVTTNLTVGANAQAALTAGDDISIDAQTINKVAVVANSTIGEYTVNQQETKKDRGIAASIPIVVMNNSTKAVVNSATLKADKNISINAETKIPYNMEHPLYNLFADGKEFEMSSLTSLLSSNLGIDKGMFNTWAQSTASTDEWGMGGMVSLQFIENETVAKIVNASVSGKTNFSKPALTVTANTVTEMGNMTGSIRSFFSRFPNFADEKSQWTDQTFQTMWGQEGEGGAIGAAFLGSFIDNTTIARIDGGTIDAGDVKVKANTSSLDIGISIGGGKAGGLGIEGMFGMTFYDSYTLAKIDDAVKVTAKSVDIFADDTAYRIGIAGGVVEGTTGIGISAIVSNLDRQAHAVWGNLLNENGKLVTIKGDSIAETLVDNPVVSVVNGDTNIKSTLSGLNVVAAVAGTKTDQTHQEEDDEAANDFSVYMQDLFDEDNPFKMDGATRKKYTKESEAESGFGVSGAVAVNVMTEKVSSGISGNVKIITNDLVVKALNSIIDISVAGGVVIQTGSEKGNTGIAGGFGINYLSGDTLAYIEPKTNTETNSIIFDSLKVDASRGGLIVSVSAGASGSSANEGTQVAGSVSYAGIFDDTLVQIKNAYLTEKSVGNVSANATNDAQIIAVGGGLAIGGKTAVGASIAVNQLSLNTHANIYNSIIDVNNLSLISGNESSIVTIALAGAVGNENAGAGTVAVVLSNGTTQTAIDSSTLTLTGNLVAGAVSKAGLGSGSYYGDLVDELQSSEGSDTSYLSNNGTTLNTKEEDNTGSDTNLALGLGNASPKIVTAALAFAVSNSAVGANIGLNILTDTTNVSISGSTISSNNVTFEAGTEGGIIAVGVGIAGGASKFGVAGNVAVNLVGGSTTVDLTNNANISATNNLTAQALNTAGITNVAVNVAGSSGTGVAASLAYNQLAHKTQVYANNTILSGGSVDIDALNSASIISVLLSVGGGGSNGVGVSLAINTIGKLSGREVENNEGGDSTNDEMEARKNLADSFGNAGIIDTIANSTNETGINLINSSITATNGNIDLDAAISGRMISIAVGAGFGGSVGAGAAGAYNNIGGASRIVTNNTAFTQNGEGKITADSVSDNDIIAVSIGGGGGGSVGVGVGAAVNNLTGVNEIKFENDTKTITANGDISLNAENSGEIISVAGGVAGGGSVGVGAAVTVNLLKGNTVAQIIGGTTISTTGNVSIKSSNDSDILSVAAAGAGGGAVGVTGSVAVNLIKGTTESRIGNSTTKTTVNGKTGVALDAKSTGKILSIGGGIAGGGAVGVAGSVAYNEISSIVRAIVEGQSSNQTSILSQNGIFAVRALNDNEIKNIIVNAAGAGTVSVAALSGTNKIAGTTEAVVKNVTATTLNAVDINATNSSDTFGVNVFAAVSGLVSVGVALDIELLEQTVKVVLENAALTASTTIDIGATNDVTIKPNVVGIAGSGVASVGGAISVVKTNSVTGVTLTNADLTATNGLSIDAASKVTLQQIIGSAAVAGVAGVAVTAGANVFNQKTNINIDQASSLISTNNNISVYGKTETDIDYIHAYSAGGGIVGVAGTVAVSVIEDTAAVTLAGIITANNGNVSLKSESIVDTESSIGGISGGVVGVSAGIDVLVVRNNATLNTAATMNAKKIDLNAELKRNIDATAFAAAAGAVGLSAGVSVINMGGTVDSDQQALFQASINKVNESLEAENKIGNVAASNAGAVTLNIGGNLTATGNDGISVVAKTDNDVNQHVYGLGLGGFVGAGAAVGTLKIGDNVNLNVLNNAKITGKKITLNSLAKETNLSQDIIAGGASLTYGLGAAVGVTDISGDVKLTIGSGAELNALSGNTNGLDGSYDIKLTAGREVTKTDIDVTAAAIGVIGLSAAVQSTKFGGTSEVNIGQNSKILAGNIYLTARDYYKSLDSSVWGGAGGAFSGAGAVDNVTINGTTNVAIGNNANIGLATGTPDYNMHNLTLTSESVIDSLKSYAKMVGAGVAAAGASNATSNVTFNSNINLNSSKLRSGKINLIADSAANTNILSTSDTYGGAGLPFANSKLNLNEYTNISLTNTTIEAENNVLLNAGGSTNNVSTTSYLYNYTAVPLNTSPDAVSNLTRNDKILISGGTIKSVGDILLYGGQGTNKLYTYSEGTNSYIAALEAIGEIFGADWSLSVKGGTSNSNPTNSITFTNANLEAGSHYNSSVTIDPSGNITSSDWVTVTKTTSSQPIYDIFQERIAELQFKILLATTFNDGVFGDVDAYKLEIQMLEQQLQYYVVDSAKAINDVARYGTANFVTIGGDITASSGDIVIKGNVKSTGTNNLTAHADPSITITNNSSNFLKLSSNLTIPYRVGGRVIVDGNVVSSESAAKHGLNNATLHSEGNAVNDPLISIKNTFLGSGGNNLSSELYIVNGTQITNPNGKVDIESKGSIWVFDSSINARDIAIKTDGSFFQGYQEGLVSVAGNPLNPGTTTYTDILAWMSSLLLFGGSGTLQQLKEQNDAAITALTNASTPDSWTAFVNDGSQNYNLLVPRDSATATSRNTMITAKNNVTNAQSDYDSALSNLETILTSLKKNSTNYDEVFTTVTVTSQDAAGESKPTEIVQFVTGKGLTDLKPIITAAGGNGDPPAVDTTTVLTTAKDNYTAANTTIDNYNSLNSTYQTATSAYEATTFIATTVAGYIEKTSLYQSMSSSLTDGQNSSTTAVLSALTTYNLAVNELQNMSTTTSWNTVFGVGGSGATNSLVAKDGVTSIELTSQITAYNNAKSTYNSAISSAANTYVTAQISSMGDVNKSLASNSSSTQVISTNLPNNEGMIYGGRSVFISAEMLNVNGLIKSGTLETIIDLTTSEVAAAINAASSDNVDISAAVFAGSSKARLSVLPQIILNKTTGNIEISDIQAMGGDITLYGNIISTGNGKLEVADGYGNIKITANAAYDLILGRVDTGLGSEGTIRIIDTAKRNNDGTPYTTVYTRTYENSQNVVNVAAGYGQNLTSTRSASTSQSVYNPKENRWLKTITGNSYTLNWNYYYDQKVGVIAGIEGDWLAKDPGDSLGGRSGSGSITPLPTGTFLVEMTPDNYFKSSSVIVGQFQRTASGVSTTPSNNVRISDNTFLGAGQRTYRKTYYKAQTFTDVFQTYLNASQPIAVNFVGEQNLANTANIGIDISGAKSVTLRDILRSVDDVTITTSGNIAGFIDNANPSKTPLITAPIVNLSAGGNIGSYDTLTNARNSNSAPTGALEIESAFTGTILKAIAGQNGTGQTATYTKDINLALTGSNIYIDHVKGKNVTITSTDDVLMKNSADGIVANNNLDLAVTTGRVGGETNGSLFKFNVGGITNISASGDIFADFVGDLHADSIISIGGDIYLNVTGNVTDANAIETDDPFSDYAARSAFWEEIGLTAGAANDLKKQNIIAAYKNAKEQDYFDAWQAVEYSIENYDAGYSFAFDQIARDGLINAGWSEQQIINEQQRRTENYHTYLQNGNTTAVYNSHYSYTVTAAEQTELTQNATWSENSLKNNVAASLFLMLGDAGERQNTTSKIEDPNISGNNVTLIAGGSIGNSNADSTVTINRSSSFNLTDAQKRALADAEFADAVFYNNTNGVISDVAAAGQNAVNKIVITSYDNLNILATGNLKLQSGNGWTNVGSQGDIKIDNTTAGSGIKAGTSGNQELRLKTDGSITAINNNNIAIYAKNAVLEAAGGTLGTSITNPLIVNLTGNNINNGWITARANDGVYISFVTATNTPTTAYIREISSQGDVYLKATSIVDALPSNANAKIGGVDIVLVATNGSIGNFTNWLPILQKENGSIILNATGNVYVKNPSGSLNVIGLSATGNAEIEALIDLLISGVININAETVLTAEHGSLKIEDGTINTQGKDFTATAGIDLSIVDTEITANTTKLTAETGDLTISGESFNVGTFNATARNDLLIKNVATTAGNTSLQAITGNLKINGESFKVGTFDATAQNDLLIENVATTVTGNTTLKSEDGDLTIVDGSLNLKQFDATAKNDLLIENVATTAGNTELQATGNLKISGESFKVGTFDATAQNDLSIENVATTAGNTKLQATGNLKISGESFKVGTFDATAQNDLSIENVATTAGNTNLRATTGNLKINGESFDVGTFDATAENDLLISDVKTTASNTNLQATTGNLKINGESFEVGTFDATAQKNISIENVVTTAGTTILKALSGDVTIDGKTARFYNTEIIAGKDVQLSNNVDVTIAGNQNNADGNVLNISAGNDILFGGKFLVEGNGKVNLVATSGEIIDRDDNDDNVINIDAKYSEVTLKSANGIGKNNSLELIAAVLNLETTGNGSISINSLADKTTIKNAKTQNGLIDINSTGLVLVGDVAARGTGSDFVLGTGGDVEFLENGNVAADQRIVIVAAAGNIYSRAANDGEAVKFNAANTNFITFDGKIYGNASSNDGFITNFARGQINVVSNGDLLIYDVSGNVTYGTVVSGNKISIFSSKDGGVSFKKIVANRIDFNQGLVKLSELSDEYYADVSSIIGADIAKIKSQNKQLFEKQFDVKIDEIEIANETSGATLEMEDLTIRSRIDVLLKIDNLEIDRITAGVDSSLTHKGGSKEVADLTLINDIIASGDFYFKEMSSNLVYVYSNSVNGKVLISDSFNGIQANYDINGVSLLIDSVFKNRSETYSYFRNENRDSDFRIWSLDGSYDLSLSREELVLSNPQLRTLSAFNHNLKLNQNTTYSDSAFDDLLVEDRRIVGGSMDLLLDSDQIFSTQVANIINANTPLAVTLVNFASLSEIFDPISPSIIPIIEDKDNKEDEEEKTENEKAIIEDNENNKVAQWF